MEEAEVMMKLSLRKRPKRPAGKEKEDGETLKLMETVGEIED